MLDIEIDGKQLQVSDGITVMEAANQVGAYVPHFCYHKKLSIAANCRMCLVQVEKAPKPLPACATPVTNGMKVWTHSEQAVKAQKGVMEFLLINHPLDCPICDQGGECQLQDLSVGYGGAQSRYQEEKRVVSNKDLGPLVSTDMTRCINCTRCVRFTTEIAGLMELGQAFRGEHAEIMPFVEKTVDTELSGNIIDLCPVGALTSKPFRFAARAWEMSRRKSVSPHDSLGSNLVVQVKHDTVKRVLPLENEEINECWLSDKDRFSYEALNGEERLTRPMVKQGNSWIETEWSVALEYVANGLKSIVAEHGADSIGALASPHATSEELYLTQSLIRGLGSGNVDFRLRQTDFSLDQSLTGAPWLGMSVADIGTLDRVLIVGSFFRKDHPLIAQRVRQAVKKGMKVSAINPAFDDWQLPIANKLVVSPDQMSRRLLGILKALSDQKGVEVSPVFGEAMADAVIDDGVLAVAGSLASGRRVAVWLGNFAIQHGNASDIHLLAQEISRVSGARFGVLGEAANSVGGYLAGAVPFGKLNGKNASEMLSTALKAYLLLNVEPELDCANGFAAVETIAKADMVAVFSAFKSKAALDYADVLLPISPFTETAGTFVNCEGRAQSFYPVVKSLGDSRPGWKVIRVLGEMLGLAGFALDSIEEVRRASFGGQSSVDESKLNNTVSREGAFVSSAAARGLQRVADIPIYFCDPLVRRSASLQATKDASEPVVRMNRRSLTQYGVEAGTRVRVSTGKGQAVVLAVEDEGVADGCVRLAGGHLLTAHLGTLNGEVSVERL
ncbi:NADH-quinone oxidoreductase subunit NuoG [Zoogloea sp.]|uniref:NADH-quinone oxidoreductase subunit NuoG n=1 Tax=Zoogloea sp. TaxID=49181 RepID=UPI001AC389F6|nr:NADH-quinone oxidoreductase subunit NuoG [Zoogloea sp.]MBN8281633.1 NADH-quinone oxidoreductase subunit G [Zoogloea sp.]